MAMKKYSTFPEVEPHHEMQFGLIPNTPLFLGGGSYPSAGGGGYSQRILSLANRAINLER